MVTIYQEERKLAQPCQSMARQGCDIFRNPAAKVKSALTDIPVFIVIDSSFDIRHCLIYTIVY